MADARPDASGMDRGDAPGRGMGRLGSISPDLYPTDVFRQLLAQRFLEQRFDTRCGRSPDRPFAFLRGGDLHQDAGPLVQVAVVGQRLDCLVVYPVLVRADENLAALLARLVVA